MNTESLKLKWERLDTVFLDLDGTLLDLHFDNYFWREYLPLHYANHSSVNIEKAQNQLCERFDSLNGTLSYYCLDFWSNELGLDILALKKEVKSKIAIRPGVEAFLTFLKENNKRTLLLTNAHRSSLDLKMEMTGLSNYFEKIYSSHDFGFPKEDQAFWVALQEKETFDPLKTLFIDDNQNVLDSAKQFGIQYLLGIFQPDSQISGEVLSEYKQVKDYSELLIEVESNGFNE